MCKKLTLHKISISIRIKKTHTHNIMFVLLKISKTVIILYSEKSRTGAIIHKIRYNHMLNQMSYPRMHRHYVTTNNWLVFDVVDGFLIIQELEGNNNQYSQSVYELFTWHVLIYYKSKKTCKM